MARHRSRRIVRSIHAAREHLMSMRPPHRRTSAATWTVVVAIAFIVAGCAGSTSPAPTGTTTAGFPLGSYAKEVDDPVVGRTRIVWTFTADGRFTEVPLALDGQRLDAYPIRGTFTAEDETVTIVATFPPDMGTSTHGWRRDGDRLWTFLIESDNPDDKAWFEGLDTRPWEPYRT
jgi:hypothetical protein